MSWWEFDARDESDTDRLAAALAATAPPRGVVSLRGTLGAGKTRFVRGVAAELRVDPLEVVSPTFVLCQTYRGERMLHHFDAYRLADDDEFLQLGADELMESEALTFVEWGERVEACLPADRLNVEILVIDTQRRRFRLEATGTTGASWLERIVARLR